MDENIQKKLLEIEEWFKRLEEENDILKIELGNSIIEKYRLDKAKQVFIDRHITQIEKMEGQITEEVKQM